MTSPEQHKELVNLVDRALQDGWAPEEVVARTDPRKRAVVFDALLLVQRLCRRCGGDIPASRRADSAYCCDAHKKAGERRRNAGLDEASDVGGRGSALAGARAPARSMWKRCNACRQSRPLKLFGRDRRTRDGLTTRCRDCRRGSAFG